LVQVSYGGVFDNKEDQQIYADEEKRYAQEIYDKGKAGIISSLGKFVDLYK
jgi:hypothetical protein